MFAPAAWSASPSHGTSVRKTTLPFCTTRMPNASNKVSPAASVLNSGGDRYGTFIKWHKPWSNSRMFVQRGVAPIVAVAVVVVVSSRFLIISGMRVSETLVHTSTDSTSTSARGESSTCMGPIATGVTIRVSFPHDWRVSRSEDNTARMSPTAAAESVV